MEDARGFVTSLLEDNKPKLNIVGEREIEGLLIPISWDLIPIKTQ